MLCACLDPEWSIISTTSIYSYWTDIFLVAASVILHRPLDLQIRWYTQEKYMIKFSFKIVFVVFCLITKLIYVQLMKLGHYKKA